MQASGATDSALLTVPCFAEQSYRFRYGDLRGRIVLQTAANVDPCDSLSSGLTKALTNVSPK